MDIEAIDLWFRDNVYILAAVGIVGLMWAFIEISYRLVRGTLWAAETWGVTEYFRRRRRAKIMDLHKAEEEKRIIADYILCALLRAQCDNEISAKSAVYWQRKIGQALRIRDMLPKDMKLLKSEADELKEKIKRRLEKGENKKKAKLPDATNNVIQMPRRGVKALLAKST